MRVVGDSDGILAHVRHRVGMSVVQSCPPGQKGGGRPGGKEREGARGSRGRENAGGGGL